MLADYDALVQQARNVSAPAYQGYGGELVAGLNSQQQAGISAVNNASGVQNPYNSEAAGLAGQSAQAINPQQFSASQLQQYENPYQKQVVNATEAEIQNQNQQQSAAVQGNAISSGAFGGDRAGIAQAALAGQQDLANNQTLAGLNTQNFQNAESEFNSQQGMNLSAAQNNAQRQLMASQQLSGLGSLAQNEALTQANAETNAGSLQQQTSQAQDTAAYNQFLQKEAYPFQTTGWLANIVEGLGSQSGGSSVGEQTQTGSTAGAIGGGLLGLASFLKDGGRVPKKAAGGSLAWPYDDMIMNGLGAGSYVPTVALPVGNTIPNGSGSNAGQVQNANSLQNMGQIAQGVQKLGNSFQNSSLGSALFSNGANSISYDDSLGLGDESIGGLAGSFRKGGIVGRHFDDGGGVGGNGGDGNGDGGGNGDGERGSVGADARSNDADSFGGLGSSQDPSSPAAFGLGYATSAQAMTNPGLAMGFAQAANTIGTQDGLGLSDPGMLGFKITTRATNDDGTVGPAFGANAPSVRLGASPDVGLGGYSAAGSMDPSHQAMANNLGMAPSIGQSEAPGAVTADASFANSNAPSSDATPASAIAALRAAMSPSASATAGVTTPTVTAPTVAPSVAAAPSDSPSAIAALRAAMLSSTNQTTASAPPSVAGPVSVANSPVSVSPVASSITPSVNPSDTTSDSPELVSQLQISRGGLLPKATSTTNTAPSTITAPYPITSAPANAASYVVSPIEMSDGSWTTSQNLANGLMTPTITSQGLARGGSVRKKYDVGGEIQYDPSTDDSLSPASLASQYANQMPAPNLGTAPSLTPESLVTGQVTYADAPGGANSALAAQYANQMPQPAGAAPNLGNSVLDSSTAYPNGSVGQAIQEKAAQATLAQAMGLGSGAPDPNAVPQNQTTQPAASVAPNVGSLSPGLGGPAPLSGGSMFDNSRQAAPPPNYGGPIARAADGTTVYTDRQGRAIDPGTGQPTQSGASTAGSGQPAPAPASAASGQLDPAAFPNTPQGHDAFIRAYATQRGVDPNFAVAVAHGEGNNAVGWRSPNLASTVDVDPRTGKPYSFGDFQLNVRNGLGTLARQNGIDPADPNQWQAADKFSIDRMATAGVRDWAGDQGVRAWRIGSNGSWEAPRIGSGSAPMVAGPGAPSDAQAYANPVSLGGAANAINTGAGFGAASSYADMPAPGVSEAQSTESPQGGGLLGNPFHLSDAQRQAMLAAAFGMMSGTSRSGFVNIGQGGLAGLQQYNQARQLPVELGLKQAQTSEAEANAETAQLNNQKIKMQVDRMWKHLKDDEAAGNDKADTIAAATAPKNVTDSTVTAPTVAPAAGQTVTMGAQTSGVPANVSSNPPAATMPSSATASSSVSGQVAPSPSRTNTPSQPSSAATSSGPRPVPDWDLANLTKQQNSALKDATYGVQGAKENVEAISARIAHIQAGGLVPMTDGTVAPYPQFGATQAARAQAVAAAQENAKIPASTLGDWEKQQVAERTKAYGEAQNASALMNQATAMKNILFDPKTGKPTINSGPLGPHLGQMAALLQQIGAPPAVVKAFTGTDADAAQELNKISTSSASEIARSELAGSPVRVSEFQTYLKTLPNSEMLPGAMKYLIDNVIVPKAQQQMGAYEAVRGLHPERGDDVQGALYDYNKKNGWATVGQPVAPAITPPAGAVTMLKQNPSLAAQFDQKYGAGASRAVLGQ